MDELDALYTLSPITSLPPSDLPYASSPPDLPCASSPPPQHSPLPITACAHPDQPALQVNASVESIETLVNEPLVDKTPADVPCRSSGFEYSSPIRGRTKAEKHAGRIHKRNKYLKKKRDQAKAAKDLEAAFRAQAEADAEVEHAVQLDDEPDNVDIAEIIEAQPTMQPDNKPDDGGADDIDTDVDITEMHPMVLLDNADSGDADTDDAHSDDADVQLAGAHSQGQSKSGLINQFLDDLYAENLTLGDVLMHVSNPANHRGWQRWKGLFSQPERVKAILDLWASSRNSKSGRAVVHAWAISYVGNLINREANSVQKAKTLFTSKKDFDASFAQNIDIGKTYADLHSKCPTMTTILRRFATTPRQEKQTENSRARKNKVIGTAIAVLLGARSQRNSLLGYTIGLYLYSTGSQRQVITVLSHFGLSCSYTSLAGSGKSIRQESNELVLLEPEAQAAQPESSQDEGDEGGDGGQRNEDVPSSPSPQGRKKPTKVTSLSNHQPTPAIPAKRSEPASKRGEGLLHRISRSCRELIRAIAETGLLGYVYDNINYVAKVAEQTIGRHSAQENGTCATAFKLHGARVEDMRTSDLIKSFNQARTLQLHDILLSQEENNAFLACLEHTVMRICVNHGGDQFQKFKEDIDCTTPRTEQTIPLHQTEIFPLPAMDIDESSTTGNAEVLDAVDTEAHLGAKLKDIKKVVKIYWGDQLSVARCRTVVNTRAGHDIPDHSYLNAAFAPGFFHYQMTATHSLLDLHWGESKQGARNPGSLNFHNTVLTRTPIIPGNLPPYRTCRDLIFVSLYARILHCLEIVSGCKDLEDYAETTTFEGLRSHAKQIVSSFANAEVAAELRRARNVDLRTQAELMDSEPDEGLKSREGDMVFENAVIFLRDALILREFTDAIKCGDMGRVITVLKIWALGFRGSGRRNYAYEVLHFVHNITVIWPAGLRDIILNNCLLNPTGRPNAWVPVDLVQEHMNYWIKVIYKAHGSNASWDWLATVSPCVSILRRLATQINSELGSHQGAKHHAPDLTRDIQELRRSLRTHNVYAIERGRSIDGEKAVVPDTFAVGLGMLQSPLNDYNTFFQKLQRRRRIVPLLGGALLPRDAEGSMSPQPSAPTPPRATEGSAGAVQDNHVPIEEVQECELSDEDEEEENELDLLIDAGELVMNRPLALESEEDVEFDMDGY